MDTHQGVAPPVPLQEIDVHTDTRQILERENRRIGREQLADLYIVDVDSHHTETESWTNILEYIEDPVVRENALTVQKVRAGNAYMYSPGGGVAHQDVAGRILHQASRREKVEETDVHRDVVLARRAMDSMGIDCTILFPTPLLALAEHPQLEIMVQLGKAYTRFVTEVLLPQENRLKTVVFLPLADPRESLKIVRRFAETPGVVGFMVTGQTPKPVHNNELMPVYAELEERGLPLVFHAGFNWNDPSMRLMNRFVGMHALSFVICNMVHMTNWVVNGMQERFPKLKVVWVESGLAWVPFLMQRLDNEFLMRPSEAPMLKRPPSEYMRDMYFASQPMERTDMEALRNTMRMINAENQLLYSSDWPHWDFDAPSVIYDLPFLSEQAKRNILGLNAKRIFNL
ncbi:MAG: amidohydrolase family protein [Alphaproteobacteria bacterium]|nr:amidohydrolase family protein [Alphaproteobacteria bacterium]